MCQAQWAGISDSWSIGAQHPVDVSLLAAEPREQADIDVASQAGLSPPLHGKAADHTETATVPVEK